MVGSLVWSRESGSVVLLSWSFVVGVEVGVVWCGWLAGFGFVGWLIDCVGCCGWWL